MITEKERKIYERLKDSELIRFLTTRSSNLFLNALDRSFLDKTIEGTENLNKEPRIFVAYHNMCLDPVITGNIIYNLTNRNPRALIDSRAFSRNKISPFLYSSLGFVPFNSTNLSKEMLRWCLKELKDKLEEKESVLIYSDGPTNSETNVPLEQKPNSVIPYRLSFDTGVPIQPISTYCPDKVKKEFYNWTRETNWNYLFGNKIPYGLSFLPVLNPEDFTSLKELRKETRTRQIIEHNRLHKNLNKELIEIN